MISGSLRWAKGERDARSTRCWKVPFPNRVRRGRSEPNLGWGGFAVFLGAEASGVVCLTDDEHAALRSRADRSKVSYRATSSRRPCPGCCAATAAAAAPRVERPTVLAGRPTTSNQLAKWANTNRVLPDSFRRVALGDIGRATAAVTETVQRVPGRL